jgi:PAS domain S-box-containing protein
MNTFIYVSTISAMTGTIAILFLYVYLYGVYRESCMGAWIVGWLLHFARIVFFDSGFLDWQSSIFNSFIYQNLYVFCALTLIYSTHLLIRKPLNRMWLYSAILTSAMGLIFNFMNLPALIRLLPATCFSSVILFCIGYVFIYELQINGAGKYVAGYAFIAWGIFTSIFPFFANDAVISQWIVLLAGLMRLVISSGILLVYFEKTRFDLIAKQGYYKSLADNSIDVVYHYQLQPTNQVKYISPSVYLITGYAPDAFYTNSKLFELLIHPDDLWSFKTYITNPSWPTDVPFDYRIIHKNKSIIYIEQTFTPIFNQTGDIIGRQGILRDVTARNNIQYAQIQYDRLNMVGKMAVTLAHQIRNPLTTIRGYLQLLRIKCTYKESYSLMIDEIDKANSIISDYVLLAQDKHTDFKKCALSMIIHSSLQHLQDYASASNVTIKTELSIVPDLSLDEMEIRCMLINLIRNGIDAMPTGGELVLRTFLYKNEVVLSIRDHGTGMPPNILTDLGTPFVTTKKTGAGLGLPLCYRIATRNRANILIDSSEKGTTFFIHFSILRLT